MAFTQTDLDSINAAITAGELRVRGSDGREVLYRSVDELLKARELVKAELDAAATPAGSRRASYHYTFTTGRGF